MARLNQQPIRLSQQRQSTQSKVSLRRFIIFLFIGLVLLLLWLDHLIITANGIAPIVRSSSYNHTIIVVEDSSAISSNNQNNNSNNDKPIQIAYAISLIRCSDFQSSTSGLLDAATILRHSIHETSVRNPKSSSKYDYKLYAIVHTKAKDCSHMLSDLGYEVILKDSPVNIADIKGEYLRKNVHKEWCCGADEFIKLYAYTINQHPIVVHTDIDFMYFQPMDDVYDAMLLPSDSVEGKMSRTKIEMEYPNKEIPNNIQAYLTRDYHQVIPGRKAAFQAGFIILKPSMDVFNEYLDIIREGNYVGGFSRENGWGGKVSSYMLKFVLCIYHVQLQ